MEKMAIHMEKMVLAGCELDFAVVKIKILASA